MWGNQANFEEIYTLNEKGKPVRKARGAGEGGSGS